MKSRLEMLSPRTLALVAAGVVLLYAVALWFVLVSPKRSDASRLSEEIVAAELRLIEAQAAAHRPARAGVQVSEVLRLAKAMPSKADQAGLVLELARLAKRSGVTLRSITPQPPTAGAEGATMIPVSVTVAGNFRKIGRFLRDTRMLVTVKRGKLRSSGRLLSVQSVDLVESVTEGFPLLDGTILIHAYVYDGPIVPFGEEDGEPEELRPTGGTSAAGRTD